MTLLELLKYRLEISKKFTKPFHEDVEKSLEDYECEPSEAEKLARLTNVNSRYEFKIPYIFATHESMLSTMFDKTPDLVFKGRGKLDEEKAKKVEAIYNYLVDVCDLESFMVQGAWWFLLTGFVKSNVAFKKEYELVPVLDDFGNEVLDENGETMTRAEYTFNDPIVTVDDPKLSYFSPESKFSEKADLIPYVFDEQLMELEEIEQTYGIKVDADSELDIKGLKESKDDLKRAKVYKCLTYLPQTEEIEKELEEHELQNSYKQLFHIVFTNKEILNIEPKQRPNIQVGKWHGAPTVFFGKGLGNKLRPFQKELSIRRGQQLRYADIAAYPKIGVEETSPVDEKALNDPREGIVLLYRDKPPVYLTAPDLSNTLILSEQKAREDAQFVSGMLDMSKGAQDSTVVKTATGQSIFAEMGERRIKQAKRQYSKFYKAVVIELLEQCKENWDEEKVITITDEEGNDVEARITGNDLADIDFTNDIDFDFESTTTNKEILRAQAIELYDRFAEDPEVDRTKLREFVLREGFNQKNPEQFTLSPEEQMNRQITATNQGQPVYGQ